MNLDQLNEDKLTNTNKKIIKPDTCDCCVKKHVDIFQFKWSKEMTEKETCDTLHTLYLLQCAMYIQYCGEYELDRYQIITNLLDWHNYDKEVNKFDGNLLYHTPQTEFINNYLMKIGGLEKEVAANIYIILKEEVVISSDKWLELPQPKLTLESYGYYKLYKDEKILEECTNEDMIKLLRYGVFASMIDANTYRPLYLFQIDEWQEKIVKYFQEKQMDGNQFTSKPSREIANSMMNYVEKGNKKLRGGIHAFIRGLKKCYVHELLLKDGKRIKIINGFVRMESGDSIPFALYTIFVEYVGYPLCCSYHSMDENRICVCTKI